MTGITGFLSMVLALAPAAPQRPNILFIMADDLGPEWLSCYGSEHQTPHLDRLAASGMRFERAYATPLCTPTRHELLTGRYPFRTGWTTHYDTPRWGGQYFDWNREITFARVLREAGYATAVAGKWQMNDFRTHPDALARHGFDEHCVWPGVESDNPPAAERYFDAYVQTNGRRETRQGEFGPDVFTGFLIDFMTRKKDGPFLAYYAMVLTHTPFTHTPANRGNESLKGAALHPGMVDHLDGEVGRLLAALERLGLRDRTVVIFTTDNGTVSGVKGMVRGRAVNGGKATLREAGIRVPLIVSWPGQVAAGRATAAPVDFSDFFPTLLELAGAAPPAGVTLDGRSFAPLLRGDPAYRPREWVFSQLGAGRIVCDGRFKLYQDGRMFDVEEDPAETGDLKDSRDPAVVAAREKLRRVLDALPADARLPFPPRSAPAGRAGE
ncbi:MAG: sulfatase [Phycisphaerae bacterium]